MSFRLGWMKDLGSTAGAEPPGQTQVSARTEPAARKRRESPAAARSVRHRHSPAATIYSGDQDQKHDLQNQTQAGLHSHRLWCKVPTLSQLLPSVPGFGDDDVIDKNDSSFRGKIVLGYTEAELRVRGSGYQFIHAADMLHCAENHVRSKNEHKYKHKNVTTINFREIRCKAVQLKSHKMIKK